MLLMVNFMRLWKPATAVGREEQHALLRMERSLRRDPGLRAAADKLSRSRPYGKDPAYECLSPWHPVLWRVTFIAAMTLIVAFIVLVATLTARVG